MIADQVGVTPCVFLAGLHRAERTIADRLTRLATLPWPRIDPDKALPWVEKHIGLALAERGRPSCADVQGHCDDRSRRRQNHHRESHPAYPRRKGH